MKLTILTIGSRGDVQPYLALAVTLKQKGYNVTLATGNNFESFVREWGVDFLPLRADFQSLIESEEGKRVLSHPLRSGKFIRETVRPMFKNLLEDAWSAAQGSDILIYHPKVLAGPHLAERLNIPSAIAITAPIITPTKTFPMPGLANQSLGSFLNRASYKLTALSLAPFRGIIQEWRQTIGLSAKPGNNGLRYAGTKHLPVLYCYSPSVLPAPSDWDEDNHVLGYWNLPARPFQPDAQLEHFLQLGEPPVYIGFGSMVGLDPARTTELVTAALKQAGVRGIIATGWGGMKQSENKDVFTVQAVSHEWLFPQVSAVVHHGGAGTTGAGLSAGRPTVICPFAVDQPFWGRVVYQLGVGPKPIPQKKLKSESLAEALRQVTQDKAMRQRAENLGKTLRGENGVEVAASWIETHLVNQK